jgi:hypothetical protein
MSVNGRAVLTVIMWGMFLGAMLLTSLGLAPFLGSNVLLVLCMFTLAGITTTGFIWNGQTGSTNEQVPDTEAMKRNRLTLALRNLSDNELASLRQRLSNGDIDDEQLARLLDESEASKAKRY